MALREKWHLHTVNIVCCEYYRAVQKDVVLLPAEKNDSQISNFKYFWMAHLPRRYLKGVRKCELLIDLYISDSQHTTVHSLFLPIYIYIYIYE